MGVAQTFPRFMDSNKTKERLQARKAPVGVTHQWSPQRKCHCPSLWPGAFLGDDRKRGAMERRMLVPAESNQSALLEPVNFWPKISG